VSRVGEAIELESCFVSYRSEDEREQIGASLETDRPTESESNGCQSLFDRLKSASTMPHHHCPQAQAQGHPPNGYVAAFKLSASHLFNSVPALSLDFVCCLYGICPSLLRFPAKRYLSYDLCATLV
jgi:hypothetical protein